MARYQVETGNKWKHSITSCCREHALVDAFKRWPPEDVGLLARVRKVGLPKTSHRLHGVGVWAYIDPIPFLRKAGFKVTIHEPMECG